MSVEIVTGDPIVRLVQLSKITDSGTVTFNIPTPTSVKCAVVSLDHKTKLTADVAATSAATGADWTTSLIGINIPKSETDGINAKNYDKGYIEIQVADSNELTWFVPVTIIEGQID